MRFLIAIMVSFWLAACASDIGNGTDNTEPQTNAVCTTNTTWFDFDKSVHFLGTALVGGAIAAYSSNFLVGVGAGIAVGAAREIWKVYYGGQCELSSITLDIVGTLVGASLGAH